MSQADIQRFISDLKEKQGLLGEVKSGAVGLASLVELAQARGYDFTVEEAKAYIRGQASQDLSDEQLDAMAGGSPDMTHEVMVLAQVVNTETSVSVTAEAVAAVAIT